jgi:hypothetical protein
MYHITNDQLDVSVLDPVEDRIRLGSRYVTGGYVYDVTDRRAGVITSGPGYPDEPFPPVFDGQGLPEAFPSFLWRGVDPVAPTVRPEPDTTMLVIGVGLVTSTTPEKFRVMPVDEFCAWSFERTERSIAMQTHQTFEDWSLDLRRELTLVNRTLISETRLANVGRAPIHFRWFPHPFYPILSGELCKFNVPVQVPDDSAYELGPSGFIQTKPGSLWDRAGNFLSVPYEPTQRLVVIQRHPVLGLLTATCSFVPSWLPIWGNKYTFSFEPYLEATIAPGADSTWSIVYDF